MLRSKVVLFGIALLLIAGAVIAQPCSDVAGKLQIVPISLNFGNVQLGSSAILQFVIRNNDNSSPMNVTKINSLNGRFQVINAPSIPFCIQENSQITLQVEFTPANTGKVVSRINVEATGGGDVNLGVEGTGTSAGSLDASPKSLNFGTVSVGQSSTKSFALINSGSGPVNVDKITSSNPAFHITSPSFPKNIGGGSQLNVNVQFTPTKSGPVNGTLAVVVLGTSGIAVSVSGEGSSGKPNITLNPGALDFGNTDVGTFNTRSVTISNTGNASLDVSFTKDANVKVTPPGPVQIAPGRNAIFNVKLIADALGPINKTYNVLSNDPDTPRAPLSLRAIGVQGPLGFVNRTLRSRIGPNPNSTSALQYVDFDNDGKTDLYLTGHDGNLMCKNGGSAQFSNSTNANKLGNNGRDSRGVTFGDVDNDGDLDVFIANFNAPSVVMRNNKNVFTTPPGATSGTPGFTTFATDLTPNSTGGIFLDFNNDSRIDIFVVKDGDANQLFKNVGTFRFSNIAASAGVAFRGPGRGAIAADFNNDGFQDLYLVNFKKANKLFLNNRNETFRDATAASGVGFTGASQQAAAIDYDGDQDLDIFVVNNEGSSVLFRNLGTGKFQNVAGASGLGGPKKGRSATWSDFDKDADLDLILAQSNGDNLLFRNNGNGKFTRVTNVDLGGADDPSSVATSDSDNDGDPDIAIGDEDAGGQSGDSIYQNSGGGTNNFLILTLQGTVSNRSAIGAKVILRVGAVFQAQVVSGGDGNNQNSLPLEFGLGAGTSATVLIAWPSGKIQSLENVAANQRLRVTEPVN